MKNLYLIQPHGSTSWLLASKNTGNDSFVCLGHKLIEKSKEVIKEYEHKREYDVTEIALSIWLTEDIFKQRR